MRIRWVKVWVDGLASLTERFRDGDGRLDFEALGREEYAFRHAIVTGDFSRSERARDLYDATISEISSRSEAGRKGAEARWNKNTAAATTREGVDESANGCQQFAGPSVNGRKAVVLGSGDRSPSPVCEKEGTFFRGSAKPKGESNTGITPPVVCPESGNLYDQEALDKPTISANSPAGAVVNLDSTHTISPDASDGNAEGVNSHGSTITRNGSRATLTSATSGQTIEALEQAGEGGVSPEVGCQASQPPSLPVLSFGEFGNIKMTNMQYAKLCERFVCADTVIEEADQYFEAQPAKKKKYKNHYAMLLNWCKRRETETKPKQGYKNINDINQENYEKAMREIEAMCAGEAVV